MAITLLDGGMGQELVARSGAEPTPLWATRIMLDRPDLVRDIHADYFAAGAQIATVNSYAIHRDRLAPQGIEDQFEDLHLTACAIARSARDAHGSGRIAGSLGPMGWSYTTDTPGPDAAAGFAEICRLQAPHVDMFLIETASSLAQARVALHGAAEAATGLPVWLGVSVMDEDGARLRSGEPVADVAALAQDFGAEAVLINCSVPEAVTVGLQNLQSAPLPFGGYANGFTGITESFAQAGSTVKELSRREDLSPDRYADFAAQWIELGATIIGGCCEVGPAHIAELHRRFVA